MHAVAAPAPLARAQTRQEQLERRNLVPQCEVVLQVGALLEIFLHAGAVGLALLEPLEGQGREFENIKILGACLAIHALARGHLSRKKTRNRLQMITPTPFMPAPKIEG